MFVCSQRDNTELAEQGMTTNGACTPKKKKSTSKEERLRTPDKKLGGLTEEDVQKLLLPDHLADHLDIIFVSFSCFSCLVDRQHIRVIL